MEVLSRWLVRMRVAYFLKSPLGSVVARYVRFFRVWSKGEEVGNMSDQAG
jgi:hypothetical protein